MAEIDPVLRLRSYYSFDDVVIDRVSKVVEYLNHLTWKSLISSLPKTKVFTAANGKPTEILDIIPEKDYNGTLVYYLPMGNPLNENMITRVAALKAALPDKRVIAVGNPGAPGFSKGSFKASEFSSVYMRGDLRATIDPTLQYLSSQGIDSVTHVGVSYGADKAAASALYADKYDQTVPRTVMIEPASIKKRSLVGLTRDFMSTAEALDEYVQASASATYLEARELSDKNGHGLLGYALGLLRMSNIAVAKALAKDGFEGRVDDALTAQPKMISDIIWGTKSELAVNSLMLTATANLIEKYGNRVRPTALEDQKHAMGDNIYLLAALTMQATIA